MGELEKQPAETRDIQSELRQKQQLQQKLQLEQQQLEQQQTQPPGQPSIEPPGPQGVPTLNQNQTVQQIEHEIQKIEESKQVGVQFCVGCKSQDDAIMFLNGEPSECSVIKGSTKELTI